MPIQFYRKSNDKNLYEQGTNRVISATEFGLGTPNAGKGFQEVKLNQQGLTMEQANDPKYWKDGKYVGSNTTTPTIPTTPITNISSSDISNGMNMSGATPPLKTADLVHETFTNNALQFTQQQQDMFKIYEQQRKDAQAEIDALNKQQTDIAAGKTANLVNYANLTVSKPGMAYQDIQRQTAVDDLVNKGITDPNQILTELNKTGSYTLDQITQNLQEHYNPTGFRQAMEDAGNKKYQLDEAYNERKKLVDETTQLSQMMYNDLQAEKNRPALISVSQGRQANIKEDYIGRISLLQATTAAIDGNINLARTFIDRGIEAVNADRNDRISFLNFYNGLLNQQDSDTKTALLTATEDEKKAITDEIGMLQGKITETENNKANIIKLLTDTQTAMTAVKAGVKITDTPDQAVQKMTEYMATAPDPELNELLSPTEAATLGVPYGTTKGQATQMKITPDRWKDSSGENENSSDGADPQLYDGLSSKTATAVRAKVAKYSTEPMVQNFATIQDGYNFASSISDTTTNPADDQALIYSLAKALDPGSVVREGEYATAQKYAQSWVKAYGKKVTQAIAGTGFLSQEARKNIKETIKQKYLSSKRSYDNLNNQYVSGINSLTGRQDGNKFLIEYSTPVEETGQQVNAGSNLIDNQNNLNNSQSTPTIQNQQGFWSKVGNWLWGE